MSSKFKKFVRTIYLYLFSGVALIIFLIGAIGLLNVALKTYVFQLEHYEEYYYYSDCSDRLYYGETKEDFDYEACEADEEEQRAIGDSDSRKRDLAIGVAQVVVAVPIWFYHWGIIQRRKED